MLHRWPLLHSRRLQGYAPNLTRPQHHILELMVKKLGALGIVYTIIKDVVI